MSTGKNTPQKIKYNLLISNLINELSSNMNANNAIIKDTNESIHIQITIVNKNNVKIQIQNRGNFHNIENTTIHDIIHTENIFNKFLKNH